MGYTNFSREKILTTFSAQRRRNGPGVLKHSDGAGLLIPQFSIVSDFQQLIVVRQSKSKAFHGVSVGALVKNSSQ
jgi:hypothetical protein